MEPRRGSIRPLSAPAWAFQTLENENGLECGRREAAGDELSGEARRQRPQAELVRRLATQGARGPGVGGAQQPPAAAPAHAPAAQPDGAPACRARGGPYHVIPVVRASITNT